MKSIIISAGTMEKGIEIARYCLYTSMILSTSYAEHCNLDKSGINEGVILFRHHFRQYPNRDPIVYVADTKMLPISTDLGHIFIFYDNDNPIACRLVDGEIPRQYRCAKVSLCTKIEEF